MHKTWPTDNLLDDMANEYAEALYPNWNFKKYGVKNPWAFRLAVKDALVITDDGEPLLDPKRLTEAVDWHMKDEIRQEEGCISDDEEAEDEAEVRIKAIRSFIFEHIGNLLLTDEELKSLTKPVAIEELEDKVLDGIHDIVCDVVLDAADRVRSHRNSRRQCHRQPRRHDVHGKASEDETP